MATVDIAEYLALEKRALALEKRALAAEHSVSVLTAALALARRSPEAETIWDRDFREIMGRTDDVEWAVGIANAMEAERERRRR